MTERSSSWGTWLIMAWGLGALAVALWKWSRLAFAVAAIVVFGIVVGVLLGRLRRRMRGYWVEYMSPNVVRAGEHDFAVIYHEGPERIYFSGVQRPRPDRSVLFIPGEQEWDSTVEPWARDRREVIVERLKADSIVRHCEIADSADAPQE